MLEKDPAAAAHFSMSSGGADPLKLSRRSDKLQPKLSLLCHIICAIAFLFAVRCANSKLEGPSGRQPSPEAAASRVLTTKQG